MKLYPWLAPVLLGLSLACQVEGIRHQMVVVDDGFAGDTPEGDRSSSGDPEKSDGSGDSKEPDGSGDSKGPDGSGDARAPTYGPYPANVSNPDHFTPGHWVQVSLNSVSDPVPPSTSALDEYSANGMQGVLIGIFWRAFETGSINSPYTTSAWAAVQTHIDNCKARGLKAGLQLKIIVNRNDRTATPPYMDADASYGGNQAGQYGAITQNSRTTTCFHNAKVQARLEAFWDEVAARWGAEPTLEWINIGEETLEGPQRTNDPTYTTAGYANGLAAVGSHMRTVMPDKGVNVSLNFLGDIDLAISGLAAGNVALSSHDAGFDDSTVLPSPTVAQHMSSTSTLYDHSPGVSGSGPAGSMGNNTLDEIWDALMNVSDAKPWRLYWNASGIANVPDNAKRDGWTKAEFYSFIETHQLPNATAFRNP